MRRSCAERWFFRSRVRGRLKLITQFPERCAQISRRKKFGGVSSRTSPLGICQPNSVRCREGIVPLHPSHAVFWWEFQNSWRLIWLSAYDGSCFERSIARRWVEIKDAAALQTLLLYRSVGVFVQGANPDFYRISYFCAASCGAKCFEHNWSGTA